MMLFRRASLLALSVASAIVVTAAPSIAQKQGGTLRIYHRDNPPSASVHEEATVSTNMPFMGIFNNLVIFDQTKDINSVATIVPISPRAGPGIPPIRS
jgi:peptide/nickel transport system substrate-binding protein